MRFSWNCLLSVEVEQRDRKLRRVSVDVFADCRWIWNWNGHGLCFWSLLFVQQATGIPFLSLRVHFHSFLLLPAKIPLVCFSSSHPGESTIWIQDDGLQILHHHKERYELCISCYIHLVWMKCLGEIVLFQKMFPRKPPAAFRFINGMMTTSVS